jgi:hypothetical protein
MLNWLKRLFNPKWVEIKTPGFMRRNEEDNTEHNMVDAEAQGEEE